MHEGPGDLSDVDGWDDGSRYELGPDPDEQEPFAGWLRRQADAYATTGTARGAWLARQIAALGERAEFLDADSPDAFDDRLDCLMDAEAARIEVREAARCC